MEPRTYPEIFIGIMPRSLPKVFGNMKDMLSSGCPVPSNVWIGTFRSADSSWGVAFPPEMPDPLSPQCANEQVRAKRFKAVYHIPMDIFISSKKEQYGLWPLL